MGKIIEVAVKKLIFWDGNYRLGKVSSQNEILEKLCMTKDFDFLVESIKKNGYQPNTLLTVSQSKDKKGFFVVFDGNRRLAVLKKLKFEKIQVCLEEDDQLLNEILDREHGYSKAGTLRWTAVQKARRELSRFRDKLIPKLNKNVKSLLIIEEGLNKDLYADFPLSTFTRLFVAENFLERLGVNISEDKVKIKNKKLISDIIEDIEDNTINSRNLNTSENINNYVDNIIDQKSKEERTPEEDISDEAPVEDDERSNRLFNTHLIERLKEEFGKNKTLIEEIEKAPLSKYSNLLALSMRAILDTLNNIYLGKKSGKSFHDDELDKYLTENDKSKKREIIGFIHELGKLAHNANQIKFNKDMLENKSHTINDILIESMLKSINKKKK